MNNRTVLLTILDGWGCGNLCPKNAIHSANLPTYNSLLKDYPHTKIFAAGEHVGLPDDLMGNSEVGHLNLGAGRVVCQELTIINKSISNGKFFENSEFLKAIEYVKRHNSSMHFMGLASSGRIHSSIEHLYALLELANKYDLKDVYVHAFLDGRDTPPRSALGFINEIEKKLNEFNFPPIASISGRYYAMDRDHRWDRTEKTYNCLLFSEGKHAKTAKETVQNSYNEDITDEFVIPTVIGDKSSRLKNNDAIIFFNFRSDRARQLTRAINDPNFAGFARKNILKNTYFICMVQYDETFNLPAAFPPNYMKNTLGEVLNNHQVMQFRTAETEKYAHITFFFNGGIERAFPTETRELVHSPKVATYDLKPEMSAYEVADKVVEAIKSKKYGFILVNFANADMVGHSGIFGAAVKAVEAVDNCLKKIVETVKETGITMILTADHGNAECMEDPVTHKPFTAHTNNEVPFILINYDKKVSLREKGALRDVAPTVLEILNIHKPSEMSGNSLIIHK